jgi:hypothetical protein
MRRAPFILTALVFLVGLPTLQGHAAPKKETVEALMKKKLVEAQKVLEGIALGEFDQVARHADELLRLSKRAEWKVLKTPLYEVYSNEFQSNIEDLIKSARRKNVDGAALAYVDLTLTCVKCHKHVRDKRMARLR